MRTMLFLTTVVLLVTVPLSAQESSSDEVSRDKSVSFTLAPNSVLEPMAEIMTEIRTGRSNSMSLLTGIGHNEHDLLYIVGAQYNWYPIGDFHHGLQAGAEVLYTHLGYYLSTRGWHLGGNALGFGPYLGYKLVLDGGLTANAQLGIQLAYGNQTYGAVLANIYGGGPEYAWGWAPLMKANVGWSF